MKKYIWGIFAVLVLLTPSCNDYLDIPTENSSPVIGMDYSNPDNLFLPLSAAYASMRNNDAFATPYYSMFEIASDNADKGSDPWDAPVILNIDSIQFDPGNYLFNNIWVATFNIVSASNYAIEAMDKFMAALPVEADRLTAKSYQGEAKFLRAYAFFNLVRLFGRVPIVDKSYSADELGKLPQASTLDIYKFIEQDLADAMSVLPTAYSHNKYPGRTTVYTAAALKAKMHMYLASVLKANAQPYQAQWDSVAVLTDKVIASNLFDLLPAFSTYFSLAGKNSKESIFEIQCSTLGNTSGGEEEKAFLQYAYQQGPRGNEPGNMQGWGLCVPSDNLISFYKSRNEVVRPATTLLYRGTLTPEGDSIKSRCVNPVYNGKVYTPSYENNWAYNGYGFDQNIRVLRYADVLLMYCEALYNGAAAGSSGLSALDAINKVRTRAQLPALSSLSDQVIWDERRAELAMEEDRFFDLIRTGQAQSVFTALGITFNPNKNNIYPIPSTQMALNKNLTQNPGY